jgi:hypothetical protein
LWRRRQKLPAAALAAAPAGRPDDLFRRRWTRCQDFRRRGIHQRGIGGHRHRSAHLFQQQRAREQEGGNDEDNAKLRSADATLKTAELDLANTEIRARAKGLVTPTIARRATFVRPPGPMNKQVGDAPFTNAASGGAGTGAITYSSGSAGVATVDDTGQVTIVAAGAAEITATRRKAKITWRHRRPTQ